LEAAAPLPKNAKLKRARRALAACLCDYRGLRISRDALRDRQASWRRIDKLAADFHDALIAELLDKRVIRIAEWRHKQKRLRIAEWSHKRVSNSLQHWRETIKAVVETLDTLMRARKGKLDPERDWLYLSLLGIWTNHFGGKLRTSTTASGGPCVRFVRTAMALVLPADEVPSTATIRAIIKAVQRGKGIGTFRPRGRGGSSHKK
jgi:citrate lyase beta subunit